MSLSSKDPEVPYLLSGRNGRKSHRLSSPLLLAFRTLYLCCTLFCSLDMSGHRPGVSFNTSFALDCPLNHSIHRSLTGLELILFVFIFIS